MSEIALRKLRGWRCPVHGLAHVRAPGWQPPKYSPDCGHHEHELEYLPGLKQGAQCGLPMIPEDFPEPVITVETEQQI